MNPDLHTHAPSLGWNALLFPVQQNKKLVIFYIKNVSNFLTCALALRGPRLAGGAAAALQARLLALQVVVSSARALHAHGRHRPDRRSVRSGRARDGVAGHPSARRDATQRTVVADGARVLLVVGRALVQ